MMDHLKWVVVATCCIMAVTGASLAVVSMLGYAAKAYLIMTDEGP